MRVAVAGTVHGQTQLSHRYASDSRNAAENCGVPRPISICGAKNRCPSRGHLVLTGSLPMWWRRCSRSAVRTVGRRKSRLNHRFSPGASQTALPTPWHVWCLNRSAPRNALILSRIFSSGGKVGSKACRACSATKPVRRAFHRSKPRSRRVWSPRHKPQRPTRPHWTSPAMARHIGISVSAVQRIWRKHSLQPHRIRQFKLSNDPRFAAKLLDIVGLYVNPPEHAIVLSIDERARFRRLTGPSQACP
jgi:hypothetical protein